MLVVVKHVVEHAVALGAEDVVPVRHDKVELGRIEMVDVFPNPAERAGLVVIAQNGQELSLAGKVHTLAQRVHVAVQEVGVERNVLSIHLQTDLGRLVETHPERARVAPAPPVHVLLAVDVAPALTHTLRRLGRDGMKRKVTTQPGDLENNFHVSSRA